MLPAIPFKQLRIILIILTFVFCLLWVYQVGRINHQTPPFLQVENGVSIYRDKSNTLDLSQIKQQQWQTLTQSPESLGLSNDSIWLKFDIPALDNNQNWLMELEFPLLDHLDVWFENEQSLKHYRTGDALPFSERPRLDERFVFPVPTASGMTKVYLKIQSKGALRAPISLWRETDYVTYSSEHNLLMGLFFGFVTAMVISNLFFFFTTGSADFFIYSAFTFCLSLLLATINGLTFKYLWPNSLWLQSFSMPLLASATCYFAIQFTDQLLDIKQHNQGLHKLMKWLSWAFLLSLISSPITPLQIHLPFLLYGLSLCLLLLFVISIYFSLKKVRLARTYTLAWSPLFVVGLASCLESLNLIGLPIHAHYLLMLATMVETTLFALVLALDYSEQRYKFIETYKQNLQQERELRLAQEQFNQAQQQAQEELEYNVGERTLELEIALRELSEKNQELEKINTIDALTGVKNRRHFDKKYIAEVRRSRREQTPLSIAMIDIDHFKRINDTHGHLVGDECIRFIARQILQIAKRPSDEVFRYGGEEFALLLPNTDQDGAYTLLEQLMTEIRYTPAHTPAGDISMTVSCGIATAIINMDTIEEHLLQQADKMLYQAKNNGRDRIECSLSADSQEIHKS
ncbi:sensor domain-containing diguanylate cyclase [Neptunicella marina]|uniref:diguanylate cyclase n=1 Tax=Neptunicella marina TaxID=2125989 RepID=A0A8J6IW07_9ALTE|nr:diguanylate cyclase [Neptunicella marina]MBC3766571.1 GGDEF domain-containing protein [Neptunicella marina]